MRIPSSLYSTEARSKPDIASSTLAPVAASIGKIGLKISNPTSRSPASPSIIASSAILGRSPDSISARRASGPGTPAALATASAISPASAPWRSSPVNSRRRKPASSSVALWSRSASSRLRSPADPLPVTACSSPIARSTSATVRLGPVAGSGWLPYTVAYPIPIRP